MYQSLQHFDYVRDSTGETPARHRSSPAPIKSSFWLLALVSICAAATLCLALSTVASARGPSGSRGGSGSGTGIGGPTTTPHSYQPFAWYTGQIDSVSGEPGGSLGVLIDQRGHTAKVASVLGTVPSYFCGDPAPYAIQIDADLIDGHREAPIHADRFHVANPSSGSASANLMTGTVTGKVHIRPHGPGNGSSAITGTLSPIECPSVQLPYHVEFRRTSSSFNPRVGGPR